METAPDNLKGRYVASFLITNRNFLSFAGLREAAPTVVLPVIFVRHEASLSTTKYQPSGRFSTAWIMPAVTSISIPVITSPLDVLRLEIDTAQVSTFPAALALATSNKRTVNKHKRRGIGIPVVLACATLAQTSFRSKPAAFPALKLLLSV